jgi:O-antigen/teichoic acid export membrane protein
MLRELINQIGKIKNEGSFARNISINSSWNVLGIVIQFLLSPIITRLYTPAEYGVFAIFNSIVLNVCIVNTFRYSDTIILTTGDKQRNNAIALSFIIVSGVSVLSLIAIFLFSSELTRFVGSAWFSIWMYLMPLSIFLAGIIEILLYLNARRNKFFLNGLSGFILNFTSRCYTIGYASFFTPLAKGLIGGDVIGKLAALFSLLFSFKLVFKKAKILYQSIDARSMLAIAKIYKHFPFYNLPSNVLASISGHIPIYFLQFQYNSSVVGAYALSSSLLEIINRLIPYSISAVFLPKAMEMKRESSIILANGAYRLFGFLFLGSFLVFGGLALVSQKIFPWVFGNDWLMAGTFTSILTLNYAINFISISLSEIYKVIGRQKLFLATTVFSVTLKASAILLSILFKLDTYTALLMFSIGGALGSILQILIVFIVLKFRVLKVSLSLVLLIAVMITTILFVNF